MYQKQSILIYISQTLIPLEMFTSEKFAKKKRVTQNCTWINKQNSCPRGLFADPPLCLSSKTSFMAGFCIYFRARSEPR